MGNPYKNYFLVTGNNALVNGQTMKNYFLVTGNNALVNGQALKIISWLLEIMPC
jgi:hypothetical protein